MANPLKTRSVIQRIPGSSWTRRKIQQIHLDLMRRKFDQWASKAPDKEERKAREKAVSLFRSTLIDKDTAVTLNLSGCKLTQLPKNIGQLQNITEFYLDDNDLEFLPRSIVDLKRLKVLTLKSNKKVQKLPPRFEQLKRLEKLELGFTGLQQIPQLPKNIQEFNLAYTNIHKLPTSLFNCKQLRILDLSGTDLSRKNLEKKTSQFKRLKSLTQLRLVNSGLEQFKKNKPIITALGCEIVWEEKQQAQSNSPLSPLKQQIASFNETTLASASITQTSPVHQINVISYPAGPPIQVVHPHFPTT